MASVTETKNKSRRQSKKFAEALAEPGQNLDTDAPLTESLDPMTITIIMTMNTITRGNTRQQFLELSFSHCWE